MRRRVRRRRSRGGPSTIGPSKRFALSFPQLSRLEHRVPTEPEMTREPTMSSLCQSLVLEPRCCGGRARSWQRR